MRSRPVVCRRCARSDRRRIARLRDDVAKYAQVVDIMHDELDNAEALCGILADKLAALDPDFVLKMDEVELSYWDSVQPFGPANEVDDEADEGDDQDQG